MNIYKFHTNPESLDHYEERLTRVPKLAYEHAKKLGRRFPEGEAVIAKDAKWSYWYAREIIKGRFPEGEAAIAKHAGASFEYAYYLKKRFPMGESEIAKDAYYAYHYAVDVIKKRFPDGEETIAKHGMYRYDYNKRFKVKL
jgi:hypothetical protein